MMSLFNNPKKIFARLGYTFIILTVLFLGMSYIHAYSFTHPTTNKLFKINKDGMQLSFPSLIKATVLGIRPLRHDPSEKPSSYDLPYESVSFKSTDNLLLKGWFIKSPNPRGTILLTHGYNGNRGNLKIAKFLNSLNYNILMFDFRGHGHSEGDSISMGYNESQDVLGAIKYLRQRSDVDTTNLYGMGQSMGAVALIFAEEEEPSFKGLILESTYTTLHQNTATRFKRVYGLPKFPFATTLTFFGNIILNINSFSHSPLEAIHTIQKPTLLIHDSLDEGVTTDDAYALHNAANAPTSLWVVNNAKHIDAYNTQTSTYEKKIMHFLEEY
jgi:pimeloyl-ACP methyl ester carboxylesterase